jgi:hypothetical protein
MPTPSSRATPIERDAIAELETASKIAAAASNP